uniref:Protein-serine/threonine phosphatase n=1 Tax=Arcella intermedia TaxID=1963864 RepID=A0A6B2L519_9EUKA
MKALDNTISTLSNLTSLSLAFNKFTSIPGAMSGLSLLTSLDMSNNMINSIQCNLPSLQKLRISSNNLASLPVGITALTNLEEIDIDGNKINAIQFGACFPKLKTLKWVNNGLTTFPNLADITSLQSLSLRQNSITVIPETISTLHNLSSLELQDNHVHTIHPSISSLTNLRVLYISYNSITQLPPQIGNLSSLEHLDISFNKLIGIPPELGNLTNLRFCMLSNNEIASVPPEIIGLSSIQGISLMDNKITYFPPEILHLRKNKVHVDSCLPDLILNGLYLGNMDSSKYLEGLRYRKITHILMVLKEMDPVFPKEFIYKKISVQDEVGETISQFFEEATDFIDEALSKGGAVLVHCAQGVSRSASIVIAYIIKSQKMTFKEALLFVQNLRPEVSPNPGFSSQLIKWEKAILGEK